MNNNKKGLSTIVATLLIILLTLVAVGIIWVVVRNVIQGGSDQIEFDSACVTSSVIATNIVNITSLGQDTINYTVTLSRTSGKDQEVAGGGPAGGVKLVFMNDDETVSFPVDVPASKYSLPALETKDVLAENVDTAMNKISVYVYFTNKAGDEQICPIPTLFEF